jgi:ubiquitin C-terminal hydrolase
MNSEKNNSTKRELENKLKNLRNKKMIDLSSILGLDYNNNYDFINSFLKQIISVLGIESMEKHIEAIDFIISNNPKDTIETFHLLHLFLLKELNIKMFQHMKNTQYISHLQDFAKLVIKSSSAFSSGMINLKTYRTGINITKNFQATL